MTKATNQRAWRATMRYGASQPTVNGTCRVVGGHMSLTDRFLPQLPVKRGGFRWSSLPTTWGRLAQEGSGLRPAGTQKKHEWRRSGNQASGCGQSRGRCSSRPRRAVNPVIRLRRLHAGRPWPATGAVVRRAHALRRPGFGEGQENCARPIRGIGKSLTLPLGMWVPRCSLARPAPLHPGMLIAKTPSSRRQS
jgi:hypothetical protein